MTAFEGLKNLKTLEIGETANGWTAKRAEREIWAAIRGPAEESSTVDPEVERLLERSERLIEESRELIRRAEELAKEAEQLAERAAELAGRTEKR